MLVVREGDGAKVEVEERRRDEAYEVVVGEVDVF